MKNTVSSPRLKFMSSSDHGHIEQLRFLTADQVEAIAQRYGTPLFVYSRALLEEQGRRALEFPAPYGLTVRYALKANPNRHILQQFDQMGLCFDASSGYEAWRAMRAGVGADKILLTSQELPADLEELVAQGVNFNACSLHQLEQYGKSFPGTSVSLRINPGLGSGHSVKTNVGGPASSFGIWYEYASQIKQLTKRYRLTVGRLHSHIGSGSDPTVWQKAAELTLEQIKAFPDAAIINLGGGFKVARMRDEIGTDMASIGRTIAAALRRFARSTGRQLHLEIEPGTFLVAGAGSLITTIGDMVDTGEEGYTFLKIDSGMTEIMR
ncbi:MAG TPA: hypothetical protein VK963_01920, partial [Candidatus Saccharimonadales bacterium]|nr:hypothetical protein [Candidatus Saccharimonadales bacterium]